MRMTPTCPPRSKRAVAESEAQSLLEQWQSGDATAESFSTLAQENSDDESTRDNGGLNENANRGQPVLHPHRLALCQ